MISANNIISRLKTYHLTLTASPHYRVKYEQVQFCKKTRIMLLIFSQ